MAQVTLGGAGGYDPNYLTKIYQQAYGGMPTAAGPSGSPTGAATGSALAPYYNPGKTNPTDPNSPDRNPAGGTTTPASAPNVFSPVATSEQRPDIPGTGGGVWKWNQQLQRYEFHASQTGQTGSLPTIASGLSPEQAWRQGATALGYPTGTAQNQATLQQIADYLARAGYPGYQATGADTISYGGQGYDVLTSGNQWWWSPDNPNAGGGGGAGGVGQGASTFSDPATAEWEALLRSVVGQLSKPVTPQDYQPTVDYLRKYASQLQGPQYSPQEQDILQTQALDPLNRSRQQQKQQALQGLSARGISPSSGVAIDVLKQIDEQFNQLQATEQGGFASQNLQNQQSREAQAAQVLTGLTQFEQALQSGNEARAVQALQLMGQLPQMANTRLQLAQSSLINPASILSMYPSFAQTGINQNAQQQQWLQMVMQLLSRMQF